MKKSIYWVYILKCENNKYYTGYTNNMTKRYESHLNGTARCKLLVALSRWASHNHGKSKVINPKL